MGSWLIAKKKLTKLWVNVWKSARFHTKFAIQYMLWVVYNQKTLHRVRKYYKIFQKHQKNMKKHALTVALDALKPPFPSVTEYFRAIPNGPYFSQSGTSFQNEPIRALVTSVVDSVMAAVNKLVKYPRKGLYIGIL